MNGANTGELTCFSEHIPLFQKKPFSFSQFSPDHGNTVEMIQQSISDWSEIVDTLPKVPYVLQYRNLIFLPEMITLRVCDGETISQARIAMYDTVVPVDAEGRINKWQYKAARKTMLLKKKFNLMVAMRGV